MSATLGFYGGVGSVTGANFLLDTGTTALLVDCGLVQGNVHAEKINHEPFAYNPADIDVLLVTHAHADHIGRIPKLVQDGFKGKIYSTTPTRELSDIMLHDALKVMGMEMKRTGLPLLYEEPDIEAALGRWETVEYDETISIDDFTVVFQDAGHILGSAGIVIERNGKRIAFSGDIGNDPQPLLSPPIKPKDYDYLVMESVYGDREHEEVAERTELLKQHIEHTQKIGGTLIIPAFSLERTQGMLYEINNLIESGQLPSLPVFLDSPLAIAVTEVYRRYPNYLKPAIQEQIKSGDDVFYFPGLQLTMTAADSREIAFETGAKIIIAGSGMSHGGRIRRHEQRYLNDPTTTVLLVGYQSVGSLGRMIHDGAKRVKIDGKWVNVRAKIARIRGYSGHADRNQLLEYAHAGGKGSSKVFVTMGEEQSSLFLVQRLRDYLDLDAVAPSQNEEVEIDF